MTQVGSNYEKKTKDKKSRWTDPLNLLTLLLYLGLYRNCLFPSSRCQETTGMNQAKSESKLA